LIFALSHIDPYPPSAVTTFQCNVSSEIIFEATGARARRPRKSTHANFLCALQRDEFDHVELTFSKSVKSKAGRVSFKLENNIEALYFTHVNDGKLTVELKQPHTFVYIDPSSESLRVDADAGKLATPLQHVKALRSLTRKLLKIQRSAKNGKDMLLTWSDDEAPFE
jgi:hypothetical protein